MVQKYIKGDIVMYDNKIHTIMDTLGLNNYELSYIEHPVHQLELSGVPLTLEILEKNGWKENKGDYINDSNHLHLCGKYDEYSVYKVVNDYNVVWLTCVRNVSDLQHLLFGLGLNSEMEV
jgi:hypothetical protein